MPIVTCRTLGPPQVTIDEVPAPAPLLWRKDLALVIYLLHSPHRTRSREHLVGLLWPDKPDSNARHSLNEALGTLRKAAGEHAIVAVGDAVQLGEAFRSDVDQFVTYMQAEEWERAASLVGGEFAEGLAVPGVHDFSEWLETERRYWRAQGVLVLTRLSVKMLAEGKVQAAVDAGRRALELDPRSDHAVQALMRGLLLLGDRETARQVGVGFVESLERELGRPPDAATQQLLELLAPDRALGDGERWHAPTEPMVGREHELSACVASWELCRQNRLGTVVLVMGESGMGVSRILRELQRRARADGGVLARVVAVETDRALPWSGVLGLASGGLLDAPGLAGAPPGSVGCLAARLATWRERFPASPLAGQDPIDMAFGEVVAAVAEERPVLLVLDEAHRLDRETLAALPGMLRRWSDLPVALALGIAPAEGREEVDALRASVGRDAPGVAVTLGPLTVRALRELAAALLPRHSAHDLDRVVRRVTTDSAGIPLLAVELLRAVVRGLELTPHARSWPESFRTLDDSLPGELPDSLVAAVRINFRRLSPAAREALAAAAILPERISAAALAHVTGRDPAEVNAAMDELEHRGWLSAEGRGYSFVATLMRRLVAHEMLTPGQRRRILERATGSS
jgi:DNA-binding SARP family transcriptional activator